MAGETSEGLESFVAIREHGSIAAAARGLGVPRETLSRRLSRLEDRLGVRLIHRHTRGLSLTTEGEVLYRHARRMVDAAEDGIQAIQSLDNVPRGVLRVSMPLGGADFVGAMLESFLDAWPEVEIEVLATSRYVDIRREGWDVALRGGQPHDDTLIARRLWRSEILAVASPTYAERRGLPESLDELGDHECLVGLMSGQRVRCWPTRTGKPTEVGGRTATNDPALRMALVRSGVGIGLTLSPFVEAELAAGTLIAVLPSVLGSDAGMSVVFPEREKMRPKVRAFIDHAVRWFAEDDVDRRLGRGSSPHAEARLRTSIVTTPGNDSS